MNIKFRSHFTQFRGRYLASCISSIMTSAICLSVPSYASDIDIYQSPKQGVITLMFMLDLSGSMTQTSVGDSACDVPSGLTINSNTTSESATTNRPYIRNYCNVTGRVNYFMRRGTSSSNYTYFRCGANGSTSTSDCTESLNSEPANLASFSTTGTNPRYYYSNGPYRYYDRLTRLKDGLHDLLQGNQANNITAISDDKVIGLAVYSSNGNGRTGHIVVPARPLNAEVNGVTQRQILLNSIAAMTAVGGTPTANAYAEVASYLLGTTTIDSLDKTSHPYIFVQNNNQNYHMCMQWSATGCADWGLNYGGFLPSMIEGLISGAPNQPSPDVGYSGTFYSQLSTNGYSGFNLSTNDSKNSSLTTYNSPLSGIDDDQKKCYGQGIYVLTDGEPNSSSTVFSQNLMQQALGGGSYASALDCSGSLFKETDGTTGWSCVSDMSQFLLGKDKEANKVNRQTNPLGLSIKTAVVGFGSSFSGIDSYNKNLNPQANASNITNNSNVSANVKNAALWGVYGEGGWYSGSNSQDIVDSVNSFLGELNTDIPSVTTGTVTIPVDQLNTIALQKNAYYPQFQPTPQQDYQLWVGNLKKYSIVNAQIVDRYNNEVVDETGRINDNYDLWSPSLSSTATTVEIAAALVGGVKSQLSLRADAKGIVNRKLLTDRKYGSTDIQSGSLNQIKLDYLTDTVTKNDPDRGYLIALLGYAIDPTNLTQLNKNIETAAELRQVGAVMHSSPILITNQGKITYTDNKIGSENRKDYVLFGTTQGLLHVVDAENGKEKFAFVPNEMIENQKQAFLRPETTSDGIDHLYYGIDGPWAVYSEYVLANNDLHTVGTGKGGDKGVQVVYGGLRMGGKSYYALDLADIDNPKLLFKINPQGICSSSNPLGCMGQSWSKPTIAWVNWKGYKKRVMFVGGGYDAEGSGSDANSTDKYKGYEYDDYNQTNKIGAGVYMFDAENGDLLWWASANASDSVNSIRNDDLKYSVVSQINALDRNADGLVDHLYFGDLGGQVWRIDLNNKVGENTKLFARTPTRILNLHNSLNPAASPRFYEAPAFSTYIGDGERFAVVSIGSGNRSTPLAEYSSGSSYTNDGIYNIYDKDVTRSDLFTLNEAKSAYSVTSTGLLTQDITLQTESSVSASSIKKLYPITDENRFSTTEIHAGYLVTSGWYYLFAGNRIQTQKVMFRPTVINYDMYVATFDASKAGMSGECGAGVKGESFATLFCMPYGQCAKEYEAGWHIPGSASTNANQKSLGVGIVGINILPGGG
ncbi:PilC/PilY family type IV pilus protein, partial [Acinetobacter stercoris]|uniref:PilC/PilY family type IV pilus protein n=1 Tax=Acinetobacter stercoris TaxID=2126983 RepID=UPI0011B240DB